MLKYITVFYLFFFNLQAESVNANADKEPLFQLQVTNIDKNNIKEGLEEEPKLILDLSNRDRKENNNQLNTKPKIEVKTIDKIEAKDQEEVVSDLEEAPKLEVKTIDKIEAKDQEEVVSDLEEAPKLEVKTIDKIEAKDQEEVISDLEEAPKLEVKTIDKIEAKDQEEVVSDLDEAPKLEVKTKDKEKAEPIPDPLKDKSFNEINYPILKLYEEGVEYLYTDMLIDEELIKLKSLIHPELDADMKEIAFEAIFAKFINKRVGYLKERFGIEQLNNFYSSEFLEFAETHHIFLNRKMIEKIINYAKQTLKENQRMTLKNSFKGKKPIIQNQDLSNLDFSLLNIADIPIWNSKLNNTVIENNQICICSDIDLSNANLKASKLHRCNECNIKRDILKKDFSLDFQMNCKNIKAERAKFDFPQSALYRSNFSGANLKNSAWNNKIILTGSNFHNANLTASIFNKFICNECDLTNANLSSIRILGYMNLIKADIDDAMVIQLSNRNNIYIAEDDFLKIPMMPKKDIGQKYEIFLRGLNYMYDLSSLNLSNRYLEIITNDKVILDNANFSNSIIENSYIDGTSLDRTNFSNSKIVDSIIIGDLSNIESQNINIDSESSIINR